MNVFAMADLHLSGAVDKPMDVFGEAWVDHVDRMAAGWDSTVGPDDLVLIPGDISWAMTLEEVVPDLQWIAHRPGRKVIIKGNHDYWWTSISKVRSILPKGIYALQNDSIALGSVLLGGTRGWALRGSTEFDVHDEKVYAREVLRLEMSLKAIRQSEAELDLNGQSAVKIAMMHYPPITIGREETEFTQLLGAYGIHHCVYGHLHGDGMSAGFSGSIGAVKYSLVSADYVDFTPRLIVEV